MNARDAAKAELQARLGHSFRDPALLEQALTHASVSLKGRPAANNERLEFLGDRVLGLLAAEALGERLPAASEGELSRALHLISDGRACAEAARRLGVPPALRLDGGESKSGGRDKDSVLGDAMEAVLAAVFLDGGLDAARAVFRAGWPLEALLAREPDANPKSALQEWAAARGLGLPRYEVVGRSGPDHAPTFTVEATLPGLDPLRAEGRSRQEAEKAAARGLLAREQSP